MKNKHPVLRRFMRRKVSVVAAAVLILFVLIAILGPLVWQVDPLKQSVMKKYGPMTVQHPLGTDNLGRDTLARMIYGARVSLAISFAGVLSGALIGVLLGVSAGYFGGWVDAIISRFIDILLAFPGLLLAITIVAVLGPGSVNTVIAITIFTIPGLTRMVRSVVLSLKSSEYVEACKTMGESNLRIIFTHVIPNSMSQIIVNVTLSLGTAILTASSLSFLGLGVTPPEAEWGAMLSQMREVIRTYPTGVLVPGIAIALACRPHLLIADEPTTALDVTIQAQIMELIVRLNEQLNMGVMLITHDLAVVAQTCSRVIVMYLGQIVEEADVLTLFDHPCHPYTEGLMRSIPRMEGDRTKPLYMIPGTVPLLSQIPTGCRFAPRCAYATERCRQETPQLTPVSDKQSVRCFRAAELARKEATAQ